jgi:hypothetical protein
MQANSQSAALSGLKDVTVIAETKNRIFAFIWRKVGVPAVKKGL